MTNHKISCIEHNIKDPINQTSLFLIEPLEVGHGITLGTSIRRTLLSDLGSYAISAMRLNGVKHEFSVIPSLREDPLDILLNLKEIVFQASSLAMTEEKKFKGVISVKGPCIVTASMFLLPYNYLRILNPNQYICTVADKSDLYLEVDIHKGKAYQLFDDTRNQVKFLGLELSKVGNTLFTDGLFMPVRSVNFGIRYINDTKGNIRESLSLEITTNGSITPKRALKESIKQLLDLYIPLLIDKNYINISNQIEKLKEQK